MATLFDENRFEEAIDSKIVKMINAKAVSSKSYNARVTRKDSSGTWWVRIPGNDFDTPVLVNKADMSVGDIVTVIIDTEKHVTIVDGNLTSPPSSTYNSQLYVDEIVGEKLRVTYADISVLKADYAQIQYAMIEDADITNARIQNLIYETTRQAEQIEANKAYIDDLEANNITAQTLSADHATIETLDATYATIDDLDAENARITTLEADNVTVNNKITAAEGDIALLKSNKADITYLEANYATIDDLDAENARITTLEADNVTVNQKITAAEGDIATLKSNKADISYLESDYIKADVIEANYAQANLANVNNAWIENGTIKDAAIVDAQILGVSANKLTAGTIDASKINVANLRAKNLVVEKLNGQPVLGGYELVNSNMSGYSSKNPTSEGWYEYSNGEWTASTDTAVVESKVYYKDADQVELYDQTYIDGLEDTLNQRIDGAVETFTGSVVPTMINYPVSDWTSSQYASHVGDIYYVVNQSSDENGYCYRFAYDNTSHSYQWVLIKDSDVTKALSDISDLQTFESETSSWIDETDEGLRTIRTNHTALSGVVDKTVKSSVQLWFTKANTTAPSAPTSKVETNNVSTANAWNLAVPTYNASYPNYYYCWQYQYADNTYGWSAVVRDVAMGETQSTARSAQTTANANIKSSVMLWFTKANATAPSKPTSVVAVNNASTANAWNQAVPTYNASYPHYFYCYQQQKGDGTYQWTDVVYDRATSETQSTARATSSSLANYISSNDAALASLQDQVDGSVDIWYGTSDPSSSVSPEKDWAAADKDLHVGDLYYNTQNGHAFRYVKDGSSYSWTLLPDSDAAAALSAAQDAQATADGKRRIFTTTPTVPYDVGDLWVNGSTVKYASVKKTADQAYSASDWSLTATDDTMAEANIKSSVMLWFSKSNATAPSKPTSQITSTGTGGNAWTTVVPTWNASYPHYFYCYQQQKGDGTWQWTDVVYDRATSEAQQKASAALPASTFTNFQQTTFKELVDEVDEQSSTISTLSSRVDQKADGSTVTTLSNTVNTVKQTADTNKTSITNLMTTTQTLRNDLDNLEVGGRNLLRWTSKPENTWTNWTNWNSDPASSTGWGKWSTAWVITDTDEGIKGTSSNTNPSGFAIPLVSNNAVVGGEEYTLSFDYRTNRTTIGDIYLLCSSGGNVLVHSNAVTASTTDWKHYEQVIKWPSTSGKTTRALLVPYFGTVDDWFEIRDRSMKLEKGNKATDWSPAPEDVEASITEVRTTTTNKFNEVEQTIDGIETSIGVIQNDLTSKADGTTVSTLTTKVNNISDTVDGHTSQITQVTTTANYAKDAFDNMEIGGRNLLKGRNLDTEWTINGLTFEYNSATWECHIYGTNTKTDAVWSLGSYNADTLLTDELVPGEDYTLTVYGNMLDANIYAQLNTYVSSGSQVGDWSVGLRSNRTSHTVPCRNTYASHDLYGNLFIGVNPDVRAIDVTFKMKFEKGNVSTDWSPAPEDIRRDLAETKTDYATFKQTVNQFQSTIGSTYATKTELSTETNRRKAQYADCTTAAGTAAKTATLANFELYTGASVTIRFNNGNTVASPTLNVNSTGAKAIVVNGTATPAADLVTWPTYATCSFTYDGTYWRLTGTDAFQKQINDAQYDIDNLEIGGRNFLLSSSDLSGNNYGSLASSPVDGGYCETKYVASSNAWQGIGIALHKVLQRIGAKIGDTVTLSIWVSNASDTDIQRDVYLYRANASSSTPGINNPGGTNAYTRLTLKSGTWVRAWATFEVTDYALNTVKTTRFETSAAASGDSDKMRWSAPKLEYGNRPTDWSPAPEDMVSQTELAAQSPYVVGTQTAATYDWTGDCPELSELRDGQQVIYWLPYSVGGSSIAATYHNISANTDVNTNGVMLTLTLADGSSTGQVPVWYAGVSRLTSHYQYGSAIRLIYRENSVHAGAYSVARGWWADANYNSDTLYSRSISGGFYTGKNGMLSYGLCMKDDNGRWTAIVNNKYSTTTQDKTPYAGGLQLGEVLYCSTYYSTNGAGRVTGDNVSIAGDLWSSYIVDFRYCTNISANSTAGKALTARKPVYLVGTLNLGENGDGLFHLDATQWWTQTEPTTEDGKVYVYLGTGYSWYQLSLVDNKPIYEFRDGKFQEFAYSRFAKVETDFIQTREQIGLTAASTLNSAKTYADGQVANEVVQRNAAILASANSITSTVSANYATKTIGNENLTPMFSSHNADGTYPDGDAAGYWQPTTDKQYNRSAFSALDDGWIHVSVSGTTQHEFAPARVEDLEAGETVTILVEWKNVSYTGNGAFHYFRDYTSANVQLGISGVNYGSSLATAMNSEEGKSWNLVTVTSVTGTAAWNALANFTFLAKDGSSSWTGDVRISFYRGDYQGPYKPYVGSKLYSSKSEIKQTADSISTEVSKKVGANEIISKINQSPEEVTISASKVNIAGAAIFSSGGAYDTTKTVVKSETQWYSSTSPSSLAGGSWSTSQPSTAAGRYIWQRELVTYANGSTAYKPSANGVCTQGQTDLSSYSTTAQANNLYDAKGAAQEAVDNLEIGGRNLFKGSATLSGGEWTKEPTSAVTVSDGVATIPKQASGESRIYQMPANGYWSWTTGENYVVSVEARTDTSCRLECYAVGAGTNIKKTFDVTTEWARYYFAFTSTNGGTGSMSLYNAGPTTGAILQLRKPMLEVGTKPTAWTVAQEDTDAAISGIVSAQGSHTVLWNYENFSTANPGEAYICKIDPLTNTKSDTDPTVMWNGVERTITKQMVNPNAILPYNVPVYIVARLGSASATTATNYMVWYASGWKYAVCPTPSAVGGAWTWAEATDIILGKFVETGSEAAFTECEIYNPPWSSKQLTTNTTTSQSAYNLANTANTNATNATAVVNVYPTAIDFVNGTATLAVSLCVGGVAKNPTSYKWTKGTAYTTSLGTGSTLAVTDLDAVYNCECTWS